MGATNGECPIGLWGDAREGVPSVYRWRGGKLYRLLKVVTMGHEESFSKTEPNKVRNWGDPLQVTESKTGNGK